MHNQWMFESLLSRPNRVIAVILLLLMALAWLQLSSGGSAGILLPHHAHHAHLGLSLTPATPGGWVLRNFETVFLMWLLMAVAMMLPTAAPAILCFADIARGQRQTAAHTTRRVATFVLGYLLAWWGLGALATAAQWKLAAAGLYFSAFNTGRALLGGALLIGAGLYQLSPLKDVCLTQCRSPMAFFLVHWRDGMRGAMYLGLRHGIDCVGCCWALMSLMLFAGTMSVVWTAGLSALMLVEKVAPAGRALARITGVALIVCGVALIVPAFFRGKLP